MNAIARIRLLRIALVVFALIDILVLVSFVFNQWFAIPVWHAVGFSALLALPLTMLVWPLVDAVLDSVKQASEHGFMGDKIPRAGQ